MSFNKLRELTNRFEQKWINGDFIFGYENEINENHNNDYPLLLVLPPTSALPTTEGDVQEEYSYECLIVKPYHQNHAGSLDSVFTLLEQEALGWLQRVLNSYANKEVILSPDSISVEREKELYNDKLIQVRLSFTLNAFSHSFTFTDESSITNLSPLVWLRSDMGVKTSFSGGNEVVSKWIDQSGNGNHFEQTELTKSPKYFYEMDDTLNTSNKNPFIKFESIPESLASGVPSSYTGKFLKTSSSALPSGVSATASIFYVIKTPDATVSQSQAETLLDIGFATHLGSKNVLSNNILKSTVGGEVLEIFKTFHFDSNGQSISVEDQTKPMNKIQVIASIKSVNTSFIYVDGNLVSTSSVNGSYNDNGVAMTDASIFLGAQNQSDGTQIGYANCSIQEFIIFNTKLQVAQIKEVSNYLKHKYSI